MKKQHKLRTIRITKYNPKFRDKDGKYTKDEWTSISDIGTYFDRLELKYEDYLIVEDAYVDTVLLIMEFLKCDKVRITHLYKYETKDDFYKYDSNSLYTTYDSIFINMIIADRKVISDLIRLRLREHIAELDIKLEDSINDEITFGFDYYMYLTTDKNIESLLPKILRLGLFID